MVKTIIVLKELIPVITVTIPMYRAFYVGWIALESLCHQENAPSWELIIAEEQKDETMGLRAIRRYTKRLESAGCVKLTYISIPSWIGLADKMALMLKLTDLKSEVNVFSGADYYSNLNRLFETFEIFKNPRVYWFIPPKVLKYHVRRSKPILMVDKTKTQRQDDTTGKAIRSSLVHEAVPYLKSRVKSVDGLMYNICKKIVGDKFHFTVSSTDSWKYNLSVEGIGCLSSVQIDKTFRRFHKRPGRYVEYPGELYQIVPHKIYARLLTLRIAAKNHKKEMPDEYYYRRKYCC